MYISVKAKPFCNLPKLEFHHQPSYQKVDEKVEILCWTDLSNYL